MLHQVSFFIDQDISFTIRVASIYQPTFVSVNYGANFTLNGNARKVSSSIDLIDGWVLSKCHKVMYFYVQCYFSSNLLHKASNKI